MVIDQIAKNPRELGYHEKEAMADNIIKHLAQQPDMTYEKAYVTLKAHKELYDEALSHLNHNAAMEMKMQPVRYALTK